MNRAVIAALVVLSLVALLAGLAPVGGDLWFHLAIGDRILDQGGIPATDPFSHTAVNDLVVHGWLADAGLAGVRRSVGDQGLRAVQAVTILLALVAWAGLLRAFGWARPLAALIPFLILVLFADRIRLRPDLFSFLFFPLFLLLLEHWRRAGVVRCRAALGAGVLVAVWANVHPAVLLAPVLAGGVWLGGLLAARTVEGEGEAPSPSPQLPLAAPFLLLIATCLNPYGPRLYPYAATVGSQVGAFVGEWGPSWVYFAQGPSRWGHALTPWATLAALVVALRDRQLRSPVVLAWLPAALIALLWAIASARFVYLAVVPLAVCLPAAWPSPAPEGSTKLGLAVAGVALMGLVATRGPALLVPLRAPSVATRNMRPAYPAAEAAFLATLPGPLRLWHPWSWGSWLSDRLQERHLIFADGRLVLYGSEVLSDNLVISAWDRSPEARAALRPKKEALLAKYRVDALVVPPKFWAPGPGWRQVHTSPTGEVWLRSP